MACRLHRRLVREVEHKQDYILYIMKEKIRCCRAFSAASDFILQKKKAGDFRVQDKMFRKQDRAESRPEAFRRCHSE